MTDSSGFEVHAKVVNDMVTEVCIVLNGNEKILPMKRKAIEWDKYVKIRGMLLELHSEFYLHPEEMMKVETQTTALTPPTVKVNAPKPSKNRVTTLSVRDAIPILENALCSKNEMDSGALIAVAEKCMLNSQRMSKAERNYFLRIWDGYVGGCEYIHKEPTGKGKIRRYRYLPDKANDYTRPSILIKSDLSKRR